MRAFIEETSPAVAYATVFANRINFNDQVDEIRYGDAHVERFFLRGVQPEYIDAFPLFAVAEGRFISALRRGARAQRGGDRARHRRLAFSLTSTRSANRCGWTAGCTKWSASSSPIRGCFRASAWISSPASR